MGYFWARTNDLSKFQVAVQWGTKSENKGTGAFILNNEWQTSGYANDLASGVPAVRDWTHVTATYTGNTLSIYLNGQWMAQREVALSTTGNSLVIGAEVETFSLPFDGQLDDLRLYNRALSDTEVTALYDLEKPDLNSGLVAYYPFNGNADDESGNGNNGTVNGATLATDRNGNADSAYSFDGNDDSVEVTDLREIDITAFTASLWINATP